MLIGMRNAMLAGGAAPGPTPAYWGLCFTAEQANSTVAMTANGSAPSVNLLYSTDATNWSPFVVGTTTVTLASVGDKVWLKAGSGGNAAMGSSTSAYNTFSLSGQIAASGNVFSLLDGENEIDTLTSTNNYAFIGLFYDCASLTAAPELPATTLSAGACYAEMFRGCTSLATPPKLPATTISSTSYRFMFYGCTSLTAAPELPATRPGSTSYISMFYGCSNLSSIKVAFSSWGRQTTNNWLSGVAANGTFYCPASLGTNETIKRGASACPTGWTVVNTDA